MTGHFERSRLADQFQTYLEPRTRRILSPGQLTLVDSISDWQFGTIGALKLVHEINSTESELNVVLNTRTKQINSMM